MNTQDVDVVIVGAGISGIGSAYHLQKHSPSKSYLIIESRENMGGTWDLFRYPGIRSDSDMFTFGFNFKPWKSPKTISPAEDIRAYIKEAAVENGIDKNIQFKHTVVAANWSSKENKWTIKIQDLSNDAIFEVCCNFFFSCGGYYNYEQGYTPNIAGMNDFKGPIIHPQHWPENIDYSKKKIIVIGSGATAVTLVPSLAKKAAHVTMLQRSPTYIMSVPDQDIIADIARKYLPEKMAYSLVRWKQILLAIFTFGFARRRPETAKHFVISKIKDILGNDYDIDKHFSPSYKPWDQRVCLVPNGDLFHAIKDGSVSMVTDHIDRITETGIELQSGETLAADMIITATGLNIDVFKGVELSVDNNPIDLAKTYCYKGMMLSGVPNFAFSIGYTNSSWTLKSDLVGEYICRLLNYMDKKGYKSATPTVPAEGIEEQPLLDFHSNYILRVQDQLPKQGSKTPWKLYQNYILDKITLGILSVNDDSINFQ